MFYSGLIRRESILAKVCGLQYMLAPNAGMSLSVGYTAGIYAGVYMAISSIFDESSDCLPRDDLESQFKAVNSLHWVQDLSQKLLLFIFAKLSIFIEVNLVKILNCFMPQCALVSPAPKVSFARSATSSFSRSKCHSFYSYGAHIYSHIKGPNLVSLTYHRSTPYLVLLSQCYLLLQSPFLIQILFNVVWFITT